MTRISGTTDSTVRQIAAAAVILAAVAGIATAATFTPTATLTDDTELGRTTTSTNVNVVGTGDDAAVEYADPNLAGTYETEDITIKHPEDRNTLRATFSNVSTNITARVEYYNTTSAAYEEHAVKTVNRSDTTLSFGLGDIEHDTLRFRAEFKDEGGSDYANLTEIRVGGTDDNEVTYSAANDEKSDFDAAADLGTWSVKDEGDNYADTARVKSDESNFSTYLGDAHIVSDESNREVAAVELSNVSTGVTIEAQYETQDGWQNATNVSVSSEGTHYVDIDEWDSHDKWRLKLVSDPGGYADITREGVGTTPISAGGSGGGGTDSNQVILAVVVIGGAVVVLRRMGDS
jgi:hypothetical protein